MSSLFWDDPNTGDLIVVKFDATTSEDPQDSLTITDHPVEQGANIVDHARDEPERITIEGYITNTPHKGNLTPEDDHVDSPVNLQAKQMGDYSNDSIELDVPDPPLEISESGLLQAGVQAVGNLITGGPNRTAQVLRAPAPTTVNVAAHALQSPTSRDRVRIAYQKLLDARTSRALVTVESSQREYFDMLIERIAKPRVTGDGTATKFSIDLRRIRIAQSQTVQSPQPAEARGASTKSLGSQSTKDDPNAAQKESLLHQQTGDLSGAP
jgi:hypothetical protein